MMERFTDLRIKAIRFWRKNKKIILICTILLLVIIIINNILKNLPEEMPELKSSYTPHQSVLNDKEVPEKYQEPIQNIIDIYFNFCNNKEYESAYNLITDECKKAYYPSLDGFKNYVDYVFNGKKKIYNIQSYSIVDDKYVYNIRILDDILANGTTDGYYYYEEKFILVPDGKDMKLSIGEFISQDNPEIIVEDGYMSVKIIDRLIDYKTETYKIIVENKSDDNYIVIADGTQNNEILLDIGTRQEKPSKVINTWVVKPGGYRVETVTFDKFYDDGNTSSSINFGAVRVLKQYKLSEGTTEDDLNNAIKLYSLSVPLK